MNRSNSKTMWKSNEGKRCKLEKREKKARRMRMKQTQHTIFFFFLLFREEEENQELKLGKKEKEKNLRSSGVERTYKKKQERVRSRTKGGVRV